MLIAANKIIDKRNVNEKRTELFAENELVGAAIASATAMRPEVWYNAEIQHPKKTEVFYAVEDIYMPCTEKKCNKEIAHVQMHQPYKKGGRSEENIAAHIVAGTVIEVVPSPKTPNIARFNFVNMIADTVTPKVHFVAVPLLGTLDNICTFDFSAGQKVSPTQIVQVWWNYDLALQLAGISEFNRLYRSLATVTAVRRVAQDPLPPPDPLLGPQSRLTAVNQYRFLHLPVEVRTKACETFLEATLRADIALEERNARVGAAHADVGDLTTQWGAANGKDFEKRLEALRSRYIGYGESRAIHTQSQILERKKKRKDKLENERAEREKEKFNIMVDKEESGQKRQRLSVNDLSTSITKLQKSDEVASPTLPLSPRPHSPTTLPFTPPSTTPSLALTPLLARDIRGLGDDIIVVNGNSGATGEKNGGSAMLAYSSGGASDDSNIRLKVELDFMTKKLEKRKATATKRKQEIERLKEENEKLKEMNISMDSKLGSFQEKYGNLKEKYQKAKEVKNKYHELEIEYVMLKTKEEISKQHKKDT